MKILYLFFHPGHKSFYIESRTSRSIQELGSAKVAFLLKLVDGVKFLCPFKKSNVLRVRDRHDLSGPDVSRPWSGTLGRSLYLIFGSRFINQSTLNQRIMMNEF